MFNGVIVYGDIFFLKLFFFAPSIAYYCLFAFPEKNSVPPLPLLRTTDFQGVWILKIPGGRRKKTGKLQENYRGNLGEAVHCQTEVDIA